MNPAGGSRRGVPIATAVCFIEGRWKVEIAWALFWGPRTIHDLLDAIPGLTLRSLRRKLDELQRSGLVSQAPPGLYQLTTLGESLKPVLGMLYEWGLRVQRGDVTAPLEWSQPV